MRKLMVAVAAVAGLALTAGCKRGPQEERRELAEAQRDVAEEQRDVAKADQERAEELRQDNASTAAVSDTVRGSVRSTTGDSLVLVVPARNNTELELKTDDKTRVTQNSREVDLDDFKEGTEVRASYVADGDELVARDVVIITPVMQK